MSAVSVTLTPRPGRSRPIRRSSSAAIRSASAPGRSVSARSLTAPRCPLSRWAAASGTNTVPKLASLLKAPPGPTTTNVSGELPRPVTSTVPPPARVIRAGAAIPFSSAYCGSRMPVASPPAGSRPSPSRTAIESTTGPVTSTPSTTRAGAVSTPMIWPGVMTGLPAAAEASIWVGAISRSSAAAICSASGDPPRREGERAGGRVGALLGLDAEVVDVQIRVARVVRGDPPVAHAR